MYIYVYICIYIIPGIIYIDIICSPVIPGTKYLIPGINLYQYTWYIPGIYSYLVRIDFTGRHVCKSTNVFFFKFTRYHELMHEKKGRNGTHGHESIPAHKTRRHDGCAVFLPTYTLAMHSLHMAH